MAFGVLILFAAILMLVGALCVGAYVAARRSRPLLSGEVHTNGLKAEIRIRRDANGIPIIEAADRIDAAFATGFVHAQERFFQMDLSRRIGAGELAALFGKKILPIDRMLRVHQFRK